jgi:hypothetical protein
MSPQSVLRAIVEVNLRWQKSVIGWVTNNLLLAPPCFGGPNRPIRALVVRAPFPLCVIHKEGLCPISTVQYINRLMTRSSMAPRSVRFGMRLRKLSNIGH